MAKADDTLLFNQGVDSPERKLWAAVVLTALDDAIREVRKRGEDHAVKEFRNWVEGRDGREVLTNAGITPTSRATEGMIAFVRRGVPTSRAIFSKSAD